MKREIKTFEHKGYTGVIAKLGYIHRLPLTHGERVQDIDWYCGYVVIPEDHPLFEVKHQLTFDTPRYPSNMHIEVHGGLSYSGRGILDTGEWLLGFDCNGPFDDPLIQDEAYTKKEIEKMIDQLIDFENKEFITHER